LSIESETEIVDPERERVSQKNKEPASEKESERQISILSCCAITLCMYYCHNVMY